MPVPNHAVQVTDLLSGTVIPIADNKLTISLKPCGGTVLKAELG